jgi:hypothetical protein
VLARLPLSLRPVPNTCSYYAFAFHGTRHCLNVTPAALPHSFAPTAARVQRLCVNYQSGLLCRVLLTLLVVCSRAVEGCAFTADELGGEGFVAYYKAKHGKKPPTTVRFFERGVSVGAAGDYPTKPR